MNVARRGRGSDQTSNGSRAETDHGPATFVAEVERAPNETSEGTSNHGVPDGEDGTDVRTESTASVETEPTEEEHGSCECAVSLMLGMGSRSPVRTAEVNEGDIVGTEVDELTLATPAQHPGVSNTANSASDFDGSST